MNTWATLALIFLGVLWVFGGLWVYITYLDARVVDREDWPEVVPCDIIVALLLGPLSIVTIIIAYTHQIIGDGDYIARFSTWVHDKCSLKGK